MYAFLCNSKGETQCGSDGCIRVDGRLKHRNMVKAVAEYRERFKKHFPHKYNHWTHVFFSNNIRDAHPYHLDSLDGVA